MINIKTFQELSNEEIYKITQARHDVFVLEQECLYRDLDDKDYDCLHFFMKDKNGTIVSYLRLLNRGVSYPEGMSIGRVLVTEGYRRKGYAKATMQAAINHAFDNLKEDTIIISAQTYLIAFYESLGFIQQGNGYLEDGIPHIQMLLQTSKKNSTKS